jgi:hypothetical protein
MLRCSAVFLLGQREIIWQESVVEYSQTLQAATHAAQLDEICTDDLTTAIPVAVQDFATPVTGWLSSTMSVSFQDVAVQCTACTE